MKKVLVGTFYILQGICHLIVFVFPIRVRGFDGLSLGALEIVIRYYFGLASGLSFFTALPLFLEKKDLALMLGIASSSLLILFYGFMITASYSAIALGHFVNFYSTLLMISLIIVVLNVVFVFGLYRLAKDKRI